LNLNNERFCDGSAKNPFRKERERYKSQMKSVNIEEIDAICAKADDLMMEEPYQYGNHGFVDT